MKTQIVQLRFAVITSVTAGMLLFAINAVTSRYMWFFFPAYALLWWPLSLHAAKTKNMRASAIIGALLMVAMLAFDNLINDSGYLWFLYTIPPILWVPVSVLVGKKAKSFSFAFFSVAVMGLTYIVLNVFYDPGHPWSVYVVFLLILWPVNTYFHWAGKPLLLAAANSVLISIYAVAINCITSPGTLWAVYVVFGCLWWILSVYYFKTKPEQIKKESNKKPIVRSY